MKLPLQVSFHNTEPVPEIEDAIRGRADRLHEFCGDIMSCRVVLDVPHKRHLAGNRHQIRIDLKVPGDEIAITRDADEDVHIAIRDAFDAAGRLLEDYVRRRRQDVKHLDEQPHARVREIAPETNYGFLETADGREVYFHRHSVLNADFDSLTPGTEVAFVEEAGEKGPQASTVRVVGRHGHR